MFCTQLYVLILKNAETVPKHPVLKTGFVQLLLQEYNIAAEMMATIGVLDEL